MLGKTRWLFWFCIAAALGVAGCEAPGGAANGPVTVPADAISGGARADYVKVSVAGADAVLVRNDAADNTGGGRIASAREAAERALAVIESEPVRAALGIDDPRGALTLDAIRSNPQTVRFEQTLHGVPVFGAEVIAKLDELGRVTSLVSHFENDLEIGTIPRLDDVAAEDAAIGDYLTRGIPYEVPEGAQDTPSSSAVLRSEDDFAVRDDATLLVAPRAFLDGGAGHALVYRVDAEIAEANAEAPLPRYVRYWIDASSGRVLAAYDFVVPNVVHHYTFDHQGTWANPNPLPPAMPTNAVLLKDENGDVSPYVTGMDPVADNAHEFMTWTRAYWVDLGFTAWPAGYDIHSHVHVGAGYNNAFWDGANYWFAFGDGDNNVFYPLANSPEVVAHEGTHAVTQLTAGLEYHDQPGAMNESLSDLFGKLVEFDGSGAVGNWLIGDEIAGPYFTSQGHAAMRDMANPTFGEPFATTNDNQPDHMSIYYEGTLDYGGVHWNSGILNKAAHLMAEGGTHYGITVPRIGASTPAAIDNMAKLYYAAMDGYLTPTSDFWALKDGLRDMCNTIQSQLTVSVTACRDSVERAFVAVGIVGTKITAPAANAYLTDAASPVSVEGLVAASEIGESLVSWTLSYKLDSGGSYTTLASGTTAVDPAGPLAAWDIASAPDGLLELRLEATYAYHSDVVTIHVTHDALLAPGWPAHIDLGTSNLVWKSPMIADLEGDGDNELIVGMAVFDADGTVHAGWDDVVGPGRTNPAVVDVDGDGALEVVGFSYPELGGYDPSAPNAGGPILYAYAPDKTALWSYAVVNPNDANNAGSVSSVSVADVDGDDAPEAVFLYYTIHSNPSEDTLLFVVDAATGAEEHVITLAGRSVGEVALADLDDDGAAEMVASTESHCYVLRADGTSFGGAWPVAYPSTAVWDAAPVIADVDRDGDLEIYANDHLWHHDGTDVAGWASNFMSSSRGALIPTADGDPELEVVRSGMNHVVYWLKQWDGSYGSLKFTTGENSAWFYMFSGAVDSVSQGAPVAADVDGDCEPEILGLAGLSFTNGNTSRLYAGETASGADAAGFPRSTAEPSVVLFSTPAVGDLDGDGETDVAIVSGSSVYVWSLGTTYRPAGNPWPMFQHDLAHTGAFDGWSKHGEPYGPMTHQTDYNGYVRYSGAAVMSMIVDSLNGTSPAPAQTSFSPPPPANGYDAFTVEDILENDPEIAWTGWFQAHTTNRDEVLYQIAYWQDTNGIAAAVPTRGDLEHWVAVEGAAAAVEPVCADMTYYGLRGLWIDDPLDGKSFKTALEWSSTYYEPTDGAYFEAVIEPPETSGTVAIELPETHAYPKGSKCQNPAIDPYVQQYAIEGIAAFRLSDDAAFHAAYAGTVVKAPIFVARPDEGNDYYLVPFTRMEPWKNGTLVERTKVLARVDAVTGQFLEAKYAPGNTWLAPPANSCGLEWHRGMKQGPFGPVLAPSYLGWWPLETASTTSLYEVIGDRSAAASAVSSFVEGMVGKAIVLNGSNYVTIADNDAFDVGTGDMSIVTWVRTTQSSAAILDKRMSSGKNVGYLLYINAGKLLFQMSDPTYGFYNYYSTGTPSLNDGAWHQVAVTVDRDNATGGKLYVDGVAVYAFNPTNRPGSLANTASAYIGRHAVSGAKLTGQVDDLILAGRSMTAAEIQTLYANALN